MPAAPLARPRNDGRLFSGYDATPEPWRNDRDETKIRSNPDQIIDRFSAPGALSYSSGIAPGYRSNASRTTNRSRCGLGRHRRQYGDSGLVDTRRESPGEEGLRCHRSRVIDPTRHRLRSVSPGPMSERKREPRRRRVAGGRGEGLESVVSWHPHANGPREWAWRGFRGAGSGPCPGLGGCWPRPNHGFTSVVAGGCGGPFRRPSSRPAPFLAHVAPRHGRLRRRAAGRG